LFIIKTEEYHIIILNLNNSKKKNKKQEIMTGDLMN